MKKYKFLPLLLTVILFIGLLPVPAAAVSDPNVTSSCAVVMDAGTGDFLYEKNSTRTVDPGSAVALMTALLVSEAVQEQQIELDDDVTAPGDVLYNLGGEGAATLEPTIQPGETMTVDELLHAILLRSAGDAANALAVYVAGSVSAFVRSMNDRAGELGCTDTVFQNTNGEPDASQRTTARDMALIAQAAAAVPTLVNTCEDVSFTINTTNMSGERILANSNLLLAPDSEYYYGEAYGLKAGYSASSGYNAMATATSGGIDAVAVVMGTDDGGVRFTDAAALFDWVFGNYSYRTIMSDTEPIDNVAVTLGTTDSVSVRPDSRIELLMPNDRDTANVQYDLSYYHEREDRELVAPVNAGTILGEVTATLDGEVLGTAHLVATGTSDMSRLEYLRTQLEELVQSESVRKIAKALVIMFGVYLLLVLFYWFQRVRHLVSLRRAKRDRARSLSRQEIAWLELPEQEEPEAPIDYFPEAGDFEGYDTGDDGYDAPAPAPSRRGKRAKPKAKKSRRSRRGAQAQPQYDDDYGYDDYDDGGEPQGRRIRDDRDQAPADDYDYDGSYDDN